jgi:Putative auto-transporter adhesin, head GIN domain
MINTLEAHAMLRVSSVLLAVLLAVLALAACIEGTIKGSGNITTEARPVDKFTAIQLSDVGHLVIERTGTESLTVTADDNLVSLFTSEVKNGTLYLSVVKGKRPATTPTYKVAVSDLRELEVSGAGSFDATKLDGDALSISISGAGSGQAAGRADSLTLSISGAGSLNAAELKAKRAKVTVSGAGDVTVNASEELDASVSGVGTIWYIGSPKVTSRVSGVGSIKQKSN